MCSITVFIFFFLISKIQTLPKNNHLYLPDDGIELLDIDNFEKVVENSSTAWFVEFYASWCGHCQRFAPLWKKFASDTRQWGDLIKVGALACSDEINIPICRDYDIVKYPTVKYFHENYQLTGENVGEDLAHDEEVSYESLKRRAIQTIIKETKEGRGKMYPNLRAYNDSLENVFDGVGDSRKFVFLVVENGDNYLGAELALDLHKTNSIAVRYALANETQITKTFNLTKFPHLLVFDKENNVQFLSNDSTDSAELKSIIAKYLHNKGTDVEKDDQITTITSIPEIENHSQRILLEHIKRMGNVVFQKDLEAALRYSLSVEVSTVEIIKGEALQALSKYLEVIKEYFPFGYNNSYFINDLTNLTASVLEVEGSKIKALVDQAEENRVFSSSETFLGCLGSSPRYRGYPCSLWKLFHYLTVNYAVNNENITDIDPRKVLLAMQGYVKYFFSCDRCSKHFNKMADEKNLVGVSGIEESFIWLWEAHNLVNARLKGDITEDPEYPKNQFPTPAACPACYDNEGAWKLNEVSQYLRTMYSKFNIRYIGSDTTVLFPGLDS